MVSAELGPELDTNPARVTGRDTLRDDGSVEIHQSYDGSGQVAAPLLRAVGRAAISWQKGRHLLGASYGGGGKLYFGEVGRLSDELVQHASLLWGVQLRKGALLRLDGGYYDAFLRQPAGCNRPGLPCPPQRDFRTGQAGAAVELSAQWLRALFKLGYFGLEFKPDGEYSYQGPVLGLSLRRVFNTGRGDATAEWSLGASYVGTLRAFGGGAQVPAPCSQASGSFECTTEGDANRRDLNHVARVDLDYLASAAGGLFYSLEINRSNSFGESYLRHAIGLKFTAPLPFRLFLTAQVVLQLSSFGDALFSRVATQSFADIDSENRSRLLLHIARDIGKHWSIALRYALYVNESGTTSTGVALPGFFRQTVFLGVRFEYDSDG